jgi:hypothetical protein
LPVLKCLVVIGSLASLEKLLIPELPPPPIPKSRAKRGIPISFEYSLELKELCRWFVRAPALALLHPKKIRDHSRKFAA